MPIVSQFVPNMFYWPGFCSGNAEACRQFYSAVLGWKAVEMAMPEGPFTSFQLHDVVVAGMYQMPDARKEAGVVSHWNSYLFVDNVQAIVDKTVQLGGQVIQKPFDADDSLMANLADPEGVKFSVWQAGKKKQEPTITNEPGAHCWTELCTRDSARAQSFYSQLFGWKPVPFDGPVPYTTLEHVEANMPVGGIYEIPQNHSSPSPQWLPYFQTADVDKTATAVEKAGGKVHGLMDVPGAGRIGMLSDSEGAGFAVINPAT